MLLHEQDTLHTPLVCEGPRGLTPQESPDFSQQQSGTAWHHQHFSLSHFSHGGMEKKVKAFWASQSKQSQKMTAASLKDH
jgi:hypothetical protein